MKGNLKINSENLFPIIKKWLYSDHDIFVRELISNGSDAITKLKKLALMNEFNEPAGEKYRLDVSVNPKDKTITFTDNGLGMTAEEVEEYINQIAFSGAKDFVEKYKDKTNDDQIIGHFGLGFYSAFMVADKVTIDTLSYRDGASAVHWVSDGGTEYEMGDSEKTERGTSITLHLNSDSSEFCNLYRIREVLEKYCSFMPYEIFLTDACAEKKTTEIPADELREGEEILETIVEPAKTEERENEDGTKEVTEVSPATTKYKVYERETPINDVHPLWNKHPNECQKDDYVSFYRKVFHDFKEPLFWIHLNMDYPFHLKGILYFPKINMEYESIEGKIKLYNNQVFIADNIKEVIPEFLMLLKGVIDCPDLPLNVSRSALQNDGFVKKISDYISKKVADKLNGLRKTDRENYEKYWDDIAPFIKFGSLKDEKFAEKIASSILFKSIYDKYLTIEDLKQEKSEKAEGAADPVQAADNQSQKEDNQTQGADNQSEDIQENTENSAAQSAESTDKSSETSDSSEKSEDEQLKIYYVTDEKAQASYIQMFKDAQKEAVYLTHNIDTPFISNLEFKHKNLKFLRIDSDIHDSLKEEAQIAEDEAKRQEELAKLVKEKLGIEKLTVKLESLANEKIASMITVSEESRRMQDMMRQYSMAGMGNMFDSLDETLILNSKNELVKKLIQNPNHPKADLISEQLYDLAKLSHGSLNPERMAKFVERSNGLLSDL